MNYANEYVKCSNCNSFEGFTLKNDIGDVKQ